MASAHGCLGWAMFTKTRVGAIMAGAVAAVLAGQACSSSTPKSEAITQPDASAASCPFVAVPRCADGQSVAKQSGGYACVACERGSFVSEDVCVDGKVVSKQACLAGRVSLFRGGELTCDTCGAAPPDSGTGSGTDGGTGCVGNLITNPSFEVPALAAGASGPMPTGWSPASPTPLTVLHPTTGLPATSPLAAPAQGNQVMHAAVSNAFGMFATGVTVSAGKTYTLTFALARPTTAVGDARFSAQLSGGPGSADFAELFLTPAMFPPAGTWVTKSVSYTATAAGAGKELLMTFGAESGADVYFDALCLTAQ